MQKKNYFSLTNDILQNKERVYVFLILILTFLIFAQTYCFEITNWDDDKYIKENPYIKELTFNSVKKIFTEPYFSNYHPVTTLSYAVEYRFFGCHSGVFHLTNLILHLINSLLVFILIRKLTKHYEIAVISTFIFALHPMHVESVAWISERKDLLYSLFFLSGLVYYLGYLKEKKTSQAVLVFILFLCSLLSKPSAVSMPLVMLLTLIYLKPKFDPKQWLHLVPFFALSILFGIIALKTQEGAIVNLNTAYSEINRLLIVVYAVYYYITRFVLPFNLATLHPFPKEIDGILPTEYHLAPFVLLALAVLIFFIKNDLRKHILYGLLFFLVTIIFVVQIIPVGKAIVSERYTYIPFIGLSLIAGHGYFYLKTRLPKKLLYFVLFLYAVFFTVTTLNQVSTWKNSGTLWSKVLEVYPDNQVALNNRGFYYTEAGDLKEALKDFNILVDMNPNFAIAYINRGFARNKLENYNEAIEDFNIAISLNASFSEAYNNRGFALLQLGYADEAVHDFDNALKIRPLYGDIYFNRGMAHKKAGHYEKAVSDFSKAIELETKKAESYYRRGRSKYSNNTVYDACTDWKNAMLWGYPKARKTFQKHCLKKQVVL